jgi:hypothetical protein
VRKAEGKELIRRVRMAVGSVDEAASGATRLGGTFNWKEKNLPERPMVTIIHAAPGRVMTPGRLQEMALLLEPEPVKMTTAPGVFPRVVAAKALL